jgi:hypothetical protein
MTEHPPFVLTSPSAANLSARHWPPSKMRRDTCVICRNAPARRRRWILCPQNGNGETGKRMEYPWYPIFGTELIGKMIVWEKKAYILDTYIAPLQDTRVEGVSFWAFHVLRDKPDEASQRGGKQSLLTELDERNICRWHRLPRLLRGQGPVEHPPTCTNLSLAKNWRRQNSAGLNVIFPIFYGPIS